FGRIMRNGERCDVCIANAKGYTGGNGRKSRSVEREFFRSNFTHGSMREKCLYGHFLEEGFQSSRVIVVFVSDQDDVDALRVFADCSQALRNLFPAESGVD